MKTLTKILLFLFFCNICPANSAQKSQLITLDIREFKCQADLNQDDFSWVTTGYTNLLQTKLLQSYADKIRIVDRQRVNMLLEEMKLSQSGLMGADQVVEPGKFLRADFVITGDVIYPVNNEVLVTAQIIDVQTSEKIVVTSSGNRKRWAFTVTDSLIPKIYNELVRFKQRSSRFMPEVTTTPDQPSALTSDIQVISAKSMSATACFYQALNYIHQTDWEHAREKLERAVELDPDFAQAYVNLGVVYMNSGEAQQARHNLLKALQIFPNSELAYFNLGLLYMQAGQYDQSINCFQQALKINPNNCETLTELGNTYIKANNSAKAKQIFHSVLNIDSLYVSAYLYLGAIARKDSLFSKAVDYWLKVIDNNEPYFRPYKQGAYENLGKYWLENEKNAAKAIPYYERARELSSKYSTVERTNGISLQLSKGYIDNNEPQKAKSMLSELIQNNPDNLHCRFLYAISLHRTSDNDQAIAQFETITKMGSEGYYFEEAKKYLKRLRGY